MVQYSAKGIARLMHQKADVALTIDLDDTADYRLSFSTLQSLRHLEDKIFPIMAALRASLRVVEWLKAYDKHNGVSTNEETMYSARRTRLTLAFDRLHGDLTSAKTLRHRIEGIVHLVG